MALISGNWKIDLLTVFIGSLAVFYFYCKRVYSYWERKGIKVIPGKHFLFGHFQKTVAQKEFVGNTVRRLYESSSEPFVGIYSVLTPILLVRDTELIRSILVKDFAHFTDRGVHCNEDYDKFSATLFTMGGQRWKDLRGKLTPAYTSGKLKAMFTTLLECGSTLEGYLDKLANKGEVLNAREIAACYTTNVTVS